MDQLKKNLNEKCTIEFKDIRKEPLFIYSIAFFEKISFYGYDKEFEKKYFNETNRSFNFDIWHHDELKEKSKLFKDMNFEYTISDKKILELKAANIEDIRRYVLQENIPFKYYNYRDSIDEIFLDENSLYSILNTYIPSYNIKLKKEIIQREIHRRKNEREIKSKYEKSLIAKTNVSIDDYILVEKDRWGSTCQDIGRIKEIKLSYNEQIEIVYNLLKTDLNESKLSLKTIYVKDIKHFISSNKMDILKTGNIPKSKNILFLFLKKNSENIK